MFIFICPGSLNFLLYLGYKDLCSMQVENLTVHRVIQNAILIRNSLQKDRSLDSPNLGPVSKSYMRWVPLQYCLSQKLACAFKEDLHVIPLDCAFALVMKCSWSESAYLPLQPGLVALQSHRRLTEWWRLVGISRGHLVQAQAGATRVSCPKLSGVSWVSWRMVTPISWPLWGKTEEQKATKWKYIKQKVSINSQFYGKNNT